MLKQHEVDALLDKSPSGWVEDLVRLRGGATYTYLGGIYGGTESQWESSRLDLYGKFDVGCDLDWVAKCNNLGADTMKSKLKAEA